MIPFFCEFQTPWHCAISNCWSSNNLSSRQLGSQMKEPPSCFSSSLVSSIREETYLEKWVTWVCRERERRCLLHNSTIFPNSTELLTTSRWRYARLEREMKWIFQLLSRRYVKHEKLHFTRNGMSNPNKTKKKVWSTMQFWKKLTEDPHHHHLLFSYSLNTGSVSYIINHVKYARLWNSYRVKRNERIIISSVEIWKAISVLFFLHYRRSIVECV